MADTYWKNRNEWVCARHLPSIRIPASEGQCFFSGCTSVRPKNRPSVEEVTTNKKVIPPKKEEAKNSGKIKVKAKTVELTKNQEDLCAWKDCDKGEGGGRAFRKPRSKYCSRDCSNKNARGRHKQRKK